MKQKFWKNTHKKFKKHLKIKDKQWEVEKKFYKKTTKYLKYIKWIPWIKMIWVWNSISMNSASKDSDIDLYIVTEKNRLWLVRIFITFIFQILWVRKTEKKHSGRFCLSFFSSLEWMDFWSFAIKDDVYLYFWIVYFKPILDYDNTYKKFLKVNSSWADFGKYKDILEENKKSIKYKKKTKKKKNNIFKKMLKKTLDLINYSLKKIFLPKTLKTYEKIWKPFWVIINDDLLKFHNWDIRKKLKKTL